MADTVTLAEVEQPDVKSSCRDRVRVVVTDLGVLEPRDDTLELVRTHPGVSVDDARAATGCDLAVAHDVGVTEPPAAVELSALQTLENERAQMSRRLDRRRESG
jgi:threonine dehydratase